MNFSRDRNLLLIRIFIAVFFFLLMVGFINTRFDIQPNSFRVNTVKGDYEYEPIIYLHYEKETEKVILKPGEPKDDLLDNLVAISLDFSNYNSDIKEIGVESISMERYFGRLGIYLPFAFKVWEGKEILEDFEVTGEGENYRVEDGILYLTSEDQLVKKGFAQTSDEISGNILPYKVALNLLALVPAFLLYLSYSYIIIAFAMLLILFALPVGTPFHESLALTILAVSMFIAILYKTNNNEIRLYSLNKLNDYFSSHKKLLHISLLSLIVILAFILRIINLNILYPYTDEYAHLLAAKSYMESGSFSYTRASLVSYLAALFYWIGGATSFYEYLYWGRVPAVIFSSLTTIPIYFLARKISLPVALISAFLWAVSPWAIGVGKTIREYAFYPFIMLLVILVLIRLLELILDYEKSNLPKIILCFLPIVVFIYYIFMVDFASTLKISLVILPVIAAYYLIFKYENIKALYSQSRFTKTVTVLLSLLVLYFFVFFAPNLQHISITGLDFTFVWLEFFGTRNVPMHWWWNHPFQYLSLFICCIGLIYAYIKRFDYHYMYLIVFVFILLFFALFYDRYVRPRYIFYALPFFIPIIALGVCGLFNYLRKLEPIVLRVVSTLAVIIFLTQAFNYSNTLYPVTSDLHGYVRPTGEYHDQLSSTFAFLDNAIEEEDVFIGTIAIRFLVLKYDIETDRLYYHHYNRPDSFDRVRSIVEKNPQGLMILDSRRNPDDGTGFPREGSFFIGSTRIEVLQNKDNMQIYRWRR